MNSILLLVGRIFLMGTFLFSLLGQMMDLAGTQAALTQARVPLPGVLIVFSLLIQIVGCLLVLLGYRTRLGVLLLSLFLIPVTLITHIRLLSPIDLRLLLENLGILGGLMILAASGPGRFSLQR